MSSFAFSLILRVATASAAPLTAVVRLPYVPHPIGVVSVSPWMTLTSLTATPSSSATICAKVVSSPWPCGDEPMKTCALPLGWKRTIALSHNPPWNPTAPATCEGPSPQISTYIETPMPRYRPFLRASACSFRRPA